MNIINRAYSLLSQHVQPQGIKILSLFGLLCLSLKTFSALNSFCRTFLTLGYNLPQRYGQGSWAVITGAAQGLGATFAEELARQGFNLVLIDVKEEKLLQTSESIKAKHAGVQIKTIVCNFAKSVDEGFFDSITEQIQGLDISLLVNNVGIMSLAGVNSAEQSILDIINVNILPATILTRRVIPLMLKRSQRSGIINVSSFAGVILSPAAPIYSATKAYVDFFTRAIEKDVSNKIDVLSLRPAFVATPALGGTPAGSYVTSSEETVKSALTKLGKVPYAHGHWRHEVKGWLCRSPTIMDLFRWHFRKYVLPKPKPKA